MLTSATAPTIAAVDIPEGGEGRAVSVEWSTGERTSYNVLWLRDNCPTGGDKRSAFRTFSVADLDPDLRITAAESADARLSVEYSDGHRSVFDPVWLAQHTMPGSTPDPVATWRSGAELPSLQFDHVMSDDGWLELLEAVAASGAVVVTEAPTDDDGSERLAARLGAVRVTDFGRFFDIVSEPDVWTMSQSTAAMDPHTDDPYRYTPSGISILHCFDASPTGGGRSTLVDGFAIAEAIRSEAPASFDLLSSVAVPWVRHRAEAVEQGDAVHMIAHAPVIAVDSHGTVSGIRFHERSMGTLDLPSEMVEPYYRALIDFTKRVRSTEFQVERALRPGDAVVFDNQRVLHGRTGFDGDPGRRHLRLCTVDRDQVHSRLRLLREQLGRGDAFALLPAGNLS